MTSTVELAAAPRGRGGPVVGTTRRFVLLIVLFLASSISMLSPVLEPLTEQLNDAAYGCSLAAGNNPDANSVWNQMITGTPTYQRCLHEYGGSLFGLFLPHLATVALVILAFLSYLLIPAWKARSGRLVPLARVDPDGSLARELDRLTARGGLRRAPRFLVDLDAIRPNAIVFGRMGRYVVRLDYGLVAMASRDSRAFEATLLHEFAHIRNRDVDITYLTVAIWRVFVVGALLPFTIAASWYLFTVGIREQQLPEVTSPAELVRTFVMVAFLVTLTYLAMADVLRTRELCADIEAVRNDADPSYWDRSDGSRGGDAIAGTGTGPGGSGRRLRWHRRWLRRWHRHSWRWLKNGALTVRTAFRLHPDWSERSAATRDSTPLLGIQPIPMFVAGAATGLLGISISFADSRQLLPGSGGTPGAVLAAGFATAIAGIAVLRSAVRTAREPHPAVDERSAPEGTPHAAAAGEFHDGTHGHVSMVVWARAGLWLGAGQLCADLVSFHGTAGVRWLPPLPQALLLALVVLVPGAVLWWVGAVGALWAGLRTRLARNACAVLTLVVAGTALAWWLGWWQSIGRFLAGGPAAPVEQVLAGFYPDMPPSPTMDVVAALTVPVTSLSYQPWTIWLSCALFALPLAGIVWRSRSLPARGGSSWSRIGLFGGIAAGVGLIIATGQAHRAIWLDRQPISEAITITTAWYFAVLLLAVVGAAVLTVVLTAVPGTVRARSAAATAMAAAGTAMAIGCAVVLALALTNGCLPPLQTVASSCMRIGTDDRRVLELFLPLVLAVAGITALVTALAAELVAGMVTRSARLVFRRRRTGSAPFSVDPRLHRPRSGKGRLTGAVLVCVSLFGSCVVVSIPRTTDASPNDDGADVAAYRALDEVFIADTSPEVLDDQVRAWAGYGGYDLFADYHQGIANLVDGVGSDGRVRTGEMREACTELIDLHDRATAYFPIPDSELQSEWSSALRDIRRAASSCLTGLERSESSTISNALRDLTPLPDPVACVEIRTIEMDSRALQRRGTNPAPIHPDLRALCPRR